MRHESRMAATRYLGLDLAWRDSRADLPANETCVAVVDSGGTILDADGVHAGYARLVQAARRGRVVPIHTAARPGMTPCWRTESCRFTPHFCSKVEVA